MWKYIKFSNINFSSIKTPVSKLGNFVSAHGTEIIAAIAGGAIADNIRVRLGRKKDKKDYERNSLKYQAVVKKHEAEINVLHKEAIRSQEAIQKVEQLEHIVNNISEGAAIE